MSENSTLIQQTVQALSFTISGDPGKLAEGEKALNEVLGVLSVLFTSPRVVAFIEG